MFSQRKKTLLCLRYSEFGIQVISIRSSLGHPFPISDTVCMKPGEAAWNQILLCCWQETGLRNVYEGRECGPCNAACFQLAPL